MDKIKKELIEVKKYLRNKRSLVKYPECYNYFERKWLKIQMS